MLTLSFIFGPRGLRYGRQLARENTLLKNSIVQLTDTIYTLEHEIKNWHLHDFFKEQTAREELQLVRADEIMYRTDYQKK